MGTLIIIAQFILSLSILITLHEMGHFAPARWFKTRVEKFYLFFDVKGISLFKKKIGETTYGIGWLPLGGYVKIAGMIDESMDKEQMAQPPKPDEFRSKPAWQRLIIMLGGVTVNFILGFLLWGMVLFVWGEEYLPNDSATYGVQVSEWAEENIGLQNGDKILMIGDKEMKEFNPGTLHNEVILNNARKIKVSRDGKEEVLTISDKVAQEIPGQFRKNGLYTIRMPFEVESVNENSPASKAGLKAEDRFLTIDGKPAAFHGDFLRYRDDLKSKTVPMQILRGNDTLALTATFSEDATLGFERTSGLKYFKYDTRKYSLGEAFPAGFERGTDLIVKQVVAFGKMFSGDIKPQDSLGGFGTIANLFPTTWDWSKFWMITAILSLILGFMNLLPIPVLDGGHVMFLLYEMITGKQPSQKFMEVSMTIGFILILALLVAANGLDIWRYFTGN